jgi:hypothetical protein
MMNDRRLVARSCECVLTSTSDLRSAPFTAPLWGAAQRIDHSRAPDGRRAQFLVKDAADPEVFPARRKLTTNGCVGWRRR